MMKKLQAWIICLLLLLTANAQEKQTTDQLVAKLGKGFVSRTARVNGTTLHYVRGGHGPAVILIHGYPQDWYAYHKVMPLLSKQFTVLAVDLRGVGGSSVTPGGYDAANMAEDIRQLTQQLQLEEVYIVGHDIGGMVAYAFARLYPKAARGAMILDVPLPGMDPWEESIAGPGFWHIPFHQTPGLPEKLVAGQEYIYIRHILPSRHFSDAEVAYYARSYATPEHLRAGFEFYRAFPTNGKFFAAQRTAVDMPLVWAGGERSFFAKYGPGIAGSLRAHGCSNVQHESIKGSEHWPANEQPALVTELIVRHASKR